jgi:3-methyl-2-oxobutanoate hydroxymethyltransferase
MPRLTVLDLQQKKADGQKIAMVTAYDRTMARLVDLAGVDIVLVGDSLGMVVQGLEDTLAVTLEEMAYHARAVSRGLQRAHLCVDMPFMTYQLSPEQALMNAGRLVKEGGAQSIKLEGGERVAAAITRIVESGIPVMGHVGLTPQSVHAMGGFRVQGKDAESARRIVADAVAVAEAGAYAVVLEGVPLDVAAEITATIGIPTIGIGAGPNCDGQVLVCTDMLGMNLTFQPKFVKRYAELETTITDAVRTYVDEVRAGAFPTEAQSFTRKRPRTIAKIYS